MKSKVQRLTEIFLFQGSAAASSGYYSTAQISFPQNRSSSGVIGFTITRINLASSILNNVLVGAADFAGVAIGRKIGTGTVTLPFSFNTIFGNDFYMAHVALCAGGATNPASCKIQEKSFPPGELVLTSNETLGIFYKATNVTDYINGVLTVEYHPLQNL